MKTHRSGDVIVKTDSNGHIYDMTDSNGHIYDMQPIRLTFATEVEALRKIKAPSQGAAIFVEQGKFYSLCAHRDGITHKLAYTTFVALKNKGYIALNAKMSVSDCEVYQITAEGKQTLRTAGKAVNPGRPSRPAQINNDRNRCG